MITSILPVFYDFGGGPGGKGNLLFYYFYYAITGGGPGGRGGLPYPYPSFPPCSPYSPYMLPPCYPKTGLGGGGNPRGSGGFSGTGKFIGYLLAV